MPLPLRFAAPAIPYFAILIGLYLLDSGWAAVLGYHVAIIVILIATKNGSVARLVFKGFDIKSAALLSLPCLLIGAVIYLAWPYARLDDTDLADTLDRFGFGGDRFYLVLIYSLVANPVLEEIFWRGLLGANSKRPHLKDLLFGGYHALVLVAFVDWFWLAPAVLSLAAASWMWRTLARRNNGLAVPVLTHLVADISIIAAVYLIML